MTSFATKLIAISTILTWTTAAFSAETIKATVNGMVCAFCAQGIEKRLSQMPAAQAVFVDLKKRVVAVEAKPGQKLNGKLITAEITDAGYDVTKLETVSQTVDQIKAESRDRK
jgi:cation transport ATPase